MNKDKFLTELRGYLSILESQEQEDILAEYAQHIDMKMQKGLSEEEAIQDFGPMQELATEILEAYHVKPEFGRRGGVFKLPAAGMGRTEKGDSFLKSGFAWTRKKTAEAVYGIGQGFRWLGEKCQVAAGWIKKLFTGRRERGRLPGNTKEDGIYMEETVQEKGQIGRVWRTIGHGTVVFGGWFASFCIFWLRFMWNAGWMLFSLFCACMSLIILMGVGAIPVLLFQGYPLIGIFMVCLGGLLCFGALSCGAFSMLVRKKKDDKDEEPEKTGEEVQYEQTA